MPRRTPLKALIVLELDRGIATIPEIQSSVTVARVKEGFSWHIFRLLLRSPITFLRIFKPVPEAKIRAELEKLIAQRIVESYAQYESYGLSVDEGYRSVNFWKERITNGAYM